MFYYTQFIQNIINRLETVIDFVFKINLIIQVLRKEYLINQIHILYTS